MTSLGNEAIVGEITIGILNAKILNPPLAGVSNPLSADLSIGNNDIIGCKNLKCSQLNFTTLNGAVIGSGTLANPLLVALDGNGAGGPYSFEDIGVGGCATLTATSAITCGSADATSGTFTTNTLTTTNDGAITGTTTATGAATTNQNSIVKEQGQSVSGNKTISGALGANGTTATTLTNTGIGTLKDLTTTGLLTCDSITDSGAAAVPPQVFTITGDLTTTSVPIGMDIGGNSATKGQITAGSFQQPIVASAGTAAVPLDLTGIVGPTLNLGDGGKGVVYAFSINPSPTFPIVFNIQMNQTDPLKKGTLIGQTQVYQDTGGTIPSFEFFEIESTGASTYQMTFSYDAPSSATTTHRISVIYMPDDYP